MRVTVADIQLGIAREYGIDPARMRDPAPKGTGRIGSNTREAAHPRQAAMALSVLLTNHSYSRIGHFFGGRDPTTVRHAAVEAAKRRRTDERLHTAMRRVTLELVQR